MISSLHMRIPPPWNSRCCRLRQQRLTLVQCLTARLTKQGQRFLSSLALAVTRDSKAASRLISKFVASSPQFIALNALSHLLSPDTTHPRLSSLAFPVSLWMHLGIAMFFCFLKARFAEAI